MVLATAWRVDFTGLFIIHCLDTAGRVRQRETVCNNNPYKFSLRSSVVKRGQNLEAEARATRPSPRPISGG